MCCSRALSVKRIIFPLLFNSFLLIPYYMTTSWSYDPMVLSNPAGSLLVSISEVALIPPLVEVMKSCLPPNLTG